MADRVIKIPGPEHPVTIENNPGRIVVTLGGEVLADTRRNPERVEITEAK
jgi:uncharacterized protein (DUF427 family)